ncbi:DUF1501 domain-containing protein [Duganella sp. Root1480D1]|uniref:DUF1501 domain-containing protein n=1 Tax=Duganella sp. Root1480D1 TaxID=1736471 RepID=UPI00070C54B0|nr:DUF1501 domain-containing protein [Duganella sp. Root1480D1]KQZ26169.1 Tat pathway signal protein [Duganella sp. Root1480D1]
MTNQASRRAFLKRASALGVAGVASPWAINLMSIAEAAAATATDYKALVCVFLYGGNDYANTVVPYDSTSYTLYQQFRPTIALARDALTATALAPSVPVLDSTGAARDFALAPALAPLVPIFNAGALGVMLNVGPLIQPTTKAQYQAKSVPLPPKLFSHNDQQSIWQSSAPEGSRFGWGGLLGDLFESGNGNATFTCVNVSGNAVYMAGKTAVQYQVSANGSMQFNGLKSPLFGSSTATEALRTLITQQRTHVLENEYNRVSRRSVDANAALTAALATAPALQTVFPASNSLGDQLKMVARMISASGSLGAKRQVFFVSMGGFDTHDNLATVHPGLMAKLGDAMAAFYQATVELGVADKVTTFTASDFGRTLVANNDGSDHGWGSMHFMMGGAVKGKRFYGTAPVVANNGADDVGQGRLLPSTSVDQYAATMGKWLGASDSDLLALLPNLSNYTTRDLGFL